MPFKKEPVKTMSTVEAADRLGVDITTIAKWVRNGTLKAYKINPRVPNSPLRILTSDVERIEQERRAGIE